MPRRYNPRNRIDVLAREAERALQAQREATLPTDAEMAQAATVRRSDVDRAIAFFREANAGTEIARLLDGPAREGEIDG